MQIDKITAILMASGFSARFGNDNKLLVPFRGKPLALYTLDLVCGLLKTADQNQDHQNQLPGFDQIFFITADDKVAALARGLPVTVIRNSAPEKGQRESIRLGVEVSDADYYLFFPCDQPLLDRETVKRIIGARQIGCIVQPCFDGIPGNPVLFSGFFRDELLSLGEGEHPRDIKKRHPETLVSVEAAGPLTLVDIDDPETLEKLERD
ncbi:MAG: nucleotidyltransferase family protein [Treponema sp.]|jgi:molybdenum cofactor cytidylyltransferase|nr:nucleotidyltransferase family protein [Treponema sp.]